MKYIAARRLRVVLKRFCGYCLVTRQGATMSSLWCACVSVTSKLWFAFGSSAAILMERNSFSLSNQSRRDVGFVSCIYCERSAANPWKWVLPMCVFAICRIYIDCKSHIGTKQTNSCTCFELCCSAIRLRIWPCQTTFKIVSADGWWDRCGHGSPCTRECEAWLAEFSARAFLALRFWLFLWRRWITELPSGGRPCCESYFSRLVCLELAVFWANHQLTGEIPDVYEFFVVCFSSK